MSVFTTGSLEVRDSSNNLVLGAGDGFGPSPFFGEGLSSTTITGSFQVIPKAGSSINIITGSVSSTGTKIGIGTVGTSPPGTAIAVYGDMGLTDTAGSKTIAMSVIDAGSVTIGTDSANYGRFEYTAATNSVQLHTRAGASDKTELMLSNNQVSVGKGSAASSGIDLEVAGTNKTVLIGDNANPPAADATLFLGNEDTKIFHDTFFGGQLVLQSTASIVLVGDRTIGATDNEFAYLKARNAASVGIAGREDVRIEAPGGLQIDNNLCLTGTLDNFGSGDQTRATFAAENGARIDLMRRDGEIFGNDELGSLHFVGSEDGGVTRTGGVSIRGVAMGEYSPSDKRSKMEFYVTPGSTSTQTLGMTLTKDRDLEVGQRLKVGGNIILNGDGDSTVQFGAGAAPTTTFSGKIKVDSNAIQNSVGDDIIAFDVNGDITTLAHRNITDQVFFQRSDASSNSAALNIFNTATDVLAPGGNIKLARKHAAIVDGEICGEVLFGAADTNISSAPTTVSKIVTVLTGAQSISTSNGSALTFFSTRAGQATPVKTHEMNPTGLTGSLGGIKIDNGNLQIGVGDALIDQGQVIFSDVPQITRDGQGVRPAILLPGYSGADVAIFRVDAGGSSEGHGFTLTYSGSGSGINNKLELTADNTFTAEDSQVMAYSIDNGGNMSIPNLIPGVVIGEDPEDSSGDAQRNPDNPSVVIAGRRESFNAYFILSKSSHGTKMIIPFNNMGTGEGVFTSNDQLHEQTKYAFIAPSDGYIESIQFLSDHMWGIAQMTGQKHEINIYKQGKEGKTNLSSLSPFVTKEFWYGFRVNPSSIEQAGEVLHMDTASRSSAAFSAGDKLYLSFQGHNSDTNWRDSSGAASSLSAYIQIQVNFVFDDRFLDT